MFATSVSDDSPIVSQVEIRAICPFGIKSLQGSKSEAEA
jgi:hypothetical protein